MAAPNSYPEVLLISEEKLKDFTSINFNVSPDDLVPFVFDAQNIYLQTYIGATYFNALKQRTADGTLTSEDIYLLDNFVGKFLCNQALYVALPFLKYKIFNKSVLSPTSENADSIGMDELKFLMSQVQDTAQNYAKRMIEWMQLHSEDYPLYNAPNSLDGQLPDKANPYQHGLVIPHYPYAYNARYGRRRGNWGYTNGYNTPYCYDLPDSN